MSDRERAWLFNYIAEGDLPPGKRLNPDQSLRITVEKEWVDYKKNLCLVFDILFSYKYIPMCEDLEVEAKTKHFYDYISRNFGHLESVKYVKS